MLGMIVPVKEMAWQMSVASIHTMKHLHNLLRNNLHECVLECVQPVAVQLQPRY